MSHFENKNTFSINLRLLFHIWHFDGFLPLLILFNKTNHNDNRTKELINILKKQIPSYAESELLNLCVNYAEIFAFPDDKMTLNLFLHFFAMLLWPGLEPRPAERNRTEFKNEILSELTKLLNIKHDFSTAHHHETVGTIERNHRVFNEYLRAYMNETYADWDTYLKYLTFLHNTTSSTVFDNKFTPFELLFGKKAILPHALQKIEIDPIYNVQNYAKEVKCRMQKSHALAKQLINKHKIRRKETYDTHARPLIVNKNDMVLIQKEPRDKHQSIYQGPITKICILLCSET